MQVRIPKFVESQVGSETKSTHRIKINSCNGFNLGNAIYKLNSVKIRFLYVKFQILLFMPLCLTLSLLENTNQDLFFYGERSKNAIFKFVRTLAHVCKGHLPQRELLK